MSGVILKASGERIALERAPTLAELQAAVGGWIERVKVKVGRDELADLIVNEEGRLRNLPVNHEASQLFWVGRLTTDPIVGDAVLLRGAWQLK